MISTEALLLIATMAVKDSRTFTAVDVPGACLQAYMENEYVVVKFEGEMVERVEMIYLNLHRERIVV